LRESVFSQNKENTFKFVNSKLHIQNYFWENLWKKISNISSEPNNGGMIQVDSSGRQNDVYPTMAPPMTQFSQWKQNPDSRARNC